MTWRAWRSGANGCVRTSILTASTTPAPHPARRVTPQNRWSQRSHKDFAETLIRCPRVVDSDAGECGKDSGGVHRFASASAVARDHGEHRRGGGMQPVQLAVRAEPG